MNISLNNYLHILLEFIFLNAQKIELEIQILSHLVLLTSSIMCLYYYAHIQDI